MSVGYTRVELPAGDVPLVSCPICGACLSREGEDGRYTTPCSHLAFIFVGDVWDFEYTSPEFDQRIELTAYDKEDLEAFPAFLEEAGYGPEMLALEISYGGIACGPSGSTAVYGFDCGTAGESESPAAVVYGRVRIEFAMYGLEKLGGSGKVLVGAAVLAILHGDRKEGRVRRPFRVYSADTALNTRHGWCKVDGEWLVDLATKAGMPRGCAVARVNEILEQLGWPLIEVHEDDLPESNFMSTEDAFEIVFDLARQNVLEEGKIDPELEPERLRQELAMDTVEDFLCNNVWD